eukprot:NODE_90_length_21806_cov_0.389137.p1 type:complete len:912 gc:universal NODE_90_length_21806_cov_0.389137:15360-12625(-)
MSTLPVEVMNSIWKLILDFNFDRIQLENIDKSQFECDNAMFFMLLSLDNVINQFQEIKSYLNTDLIKSLLDIVGIILKTVDGNRIDNLKIILGNLNPILLATWVDNFILVLENTLQDKISIDQLQSWKLSLTDVTSQIVGTKSERKRRSLTQLVFDKKKGNNESMKKPWDMVLALKLVPESITLVNEDLKKMLNGSNRKNDPITIFCFKFYDLLFKTDPTLAAMFPDESTQRKAFTRMIDAMITKSNRLEENNYYFKKLGRRHIEEYQVEKKNLEAFSDSLIETFDIILGDSFGFTAKRAWKNGFATIINMMVEGANEKDIVHRSSIDKTGDQISQVELRNMRRSWELVKNMNLDPKRLKFKTYDMKLLFDKNPAPSNLEYFTLKMYDSLFFENPSFRYYFADYASLARMFNGLFDVILVKYEDTKDFVRFAKNLGKFHLEQFKLSFSVFAKIKDATIKTLQEFLLDKLSVNLLKSWKTCIDNIIQMMAEGQKEMNQQNEDGFGSVVAGQFSAEKLERIRATWETVLTKNIPITSFKFKCNDQLLLQGQNKSELKMQTIFAIKYFDNLCWEHPELSSIYNSVEKQKKEFGSMIFNITEKIEYLEYYEEKIREQGRKQSEQMMMKSEYYEWQTKCLISTLKEFLIDTFDTYSKFAWREAADIINTFLIEGPRVRRRADTNTMLSRPTKSFVCRLSPLQVKIITRSWERILLLKIDTKSITLNHFPKDTLEYQKNPTTIFSYKYYDNLFTEDKDFVKFFPDVFSQSKAFGGLLSIVVKKFEFLDENEEKIRELGKQHEDWGVKPEMYYKLTSCLIKTLRDILLAEFDYETEEAWTAALQTVADLMIEGPIKKGTLRGRRASETADSVAKTKRQASEAKFLAIESNGNLNGKLPSAHASKESLYSQKRALNDIP